MLVYIYTDGGADPNPGIGGWAAILRTGSHERVLTGGELRTTNNRMELQAAISAFEALKYSCQVIVHTDSQYLQKALDGGIEKWRENNWQRKGKPIPNADLWKRLWELVQGHDVEWVWIRGHSGHPLNERADALARQARQSISPGRELPEGVPRLYVKASCKGNPGPGGWGAVLEVGDQTEQASGSEPKTTNNRMELLAVIEGLRMVPAGSQILVFTTSDYVYQGATRWINGWRQRGWRKKDGQEISNKDLWLRLNELLQEYEIQFVSAKGDRLEESPGLIEASKLAVAIRNLH